MDVLGDATVGTSAAATHVVDATVPSVVAAAVAPEECARAVEEEIINSQEKLEKKATKNARKRIARMFEEFRNGRDLSVALMDDFLHTIERTSGRADSGKKSASTMWTYRSHLLKYIQQHYHVDYSNEGSYRVRDCYNLPSFALPVLKIF